MASKTDLSGTKFLIAAGALAGTVGGWILLSLAGGGGGAGSGYVQDPAIVELLNRPMPTLAFPLAQTPGAGSDPGASTNIQPTAEPTLRSVVNIPAPPPVAVTQSSR